MHNENIQTQICILSIYLNVLIYNNKRTLKYIIIISIAEYITTYKTIKKLKMYIIISMLSRLVKLQISASFLFNLKYDSVVPTSTTLIFCRDIAGLFRSH